VRKGQVRLSPFAPFASVPFCVRQEQRFTGKEREGETGADYFGARWLHAGFGRFTSPDPLLNSGRPWQPQSWNRYAYTLNNPLKFIDPTGLYEWDAKCKNGDSACEENRQKFRDGVAQLNAALGKAKEGSDEYKAIKGVLDRIGTEGDGNKIRVAFSSKLEALGDTRPTLGGNIKMTFNFGLLEGTLAKDGYQGDAVGFARASLIGHEGTHAMEGVGRGIKWLFSGQERLNFEGRAINTESLYYKSINRYEPFGPLWNPAWLEADRDKIEQKRREAVESMTEKLYGGKPKLP
jgi:RHS repeat-associated protein